MNIFLTQQLPGRTVHTGNGDEYLWFSGTDYLGMGNNDDFRRLLNEGVARYGTHFGSSRNNSLRLEIYEEAESLFASIANVSSALLVSSGMWAGQLVMKEIQKIIGQAFNDSKFQYHYAPGVHPAIWGDNYQPVRGTWVDWALETIKSVNESSDARAHIICSDAVGSPWVQQFDFSLFYEIENHRNVWFIIDESHSLGLLGNSGHGIGEYFPAAVKAKTVFVSSLNKALGIPAGLIWGDSPITNQILKSPWFAGASPPAPAYVYAFNKLLQDCVYEKELQKLRNNLNYFSTQFPQADHFQTIKNYPVFCSQDFDLFDHLLKNMIMTSCFSYPAPTDPAVTRFAISSIHQKEDLNQLAEVFMKFF
ncbi:pyridoxal phosphate-dependent aminotransferase family protein [Dyadobacter arcticus]|uniref:7-keto-8-aminopelargonate synthetase-like enzyme n=1 Tax=Dyadobacter arcticus TaxID=1078754 RepID=A0ABX0UYQ7_9BACT|nr:pyridoxal phosphate-dependent aminotransferase family protein [Dyadobacter arcticus]NIJ56031.1 7-keto-8-aminopelargonate synthetase-like enzyme [Dyadobacter arcticus]